MAFKFKKVNTKYTAGFSAPSKPQFARDGEEVLTGYVDGIPAKRDEEFFMSEVRKVPSVKNSTFRMAVGAPRNMPGWLELDALLETMGGFRAFEIDDMSFVHLGQRENAETKVKDLRRVAGLAKYGISVPKGIEHLDAADLETRAQTKNVVRELRLTDGAPQTPQTPQTTETKPSDQLPKVEQQQIYDAQILKDKLAYVEIQPGNTGTNTVTKSSTKSKSWRPS